MVFPAYAGMFRSSRLAQHYVRRFPRIRGDVPQPAAVTALQIQFSPLARGCSARNPNPRRRHPVFPACAGMFPLSLPTCQTPGRFPRMRGDVPSAAGTARLEAGFSPHARGYSRSKTCNEEDSSEKNLVNKEVYSASRLSTLVTT